MEDYSAEEVKELLIRELKNVGFTIDDDLAGQNIGMTIHPDGKSLEENLRSQAARCKVSHVGSIGTFDVKKIEEENQQRHFFVTFKIGEPSIITAERIKKLLLQELEEIGVVVQEKDEFLGTTKGMMLSLTNNHLEKGTISTAAQGIKISAKGTIANLRVTEQKPQDNQRFFSITCEIE